MNKYNAVLLRFGKAFIAGAFSTAGSVTYFAGVKTWGELGTALGALGVSLVIGGITGVLMAGEKWYNWKE